MADRVLFVINFDLCGPIFEESLGEPRCYGGVDIRELVNTSATCSDQTHSSIRLRLLSDAAETTPN